MVEIADKTALPGRRKVQSLQTRELIVASAGELFLANGYLSTSIEAIATLAGVAIQTIYNSVGNKPALLSAVFDAAVAGPSAPASVPEFMQDRMAGTDDVPGAIAVLADWFAEGMPRSRAVLTIISQAAAVDPAVAALRDERAAQRLANYRLAAAAIRLRGGLGNGMSDEDAAAAIFTLGHPDSYATLVAQLGWSVQRYRDWIHTALLSTLS